MVLWRLAGDEKSIANNNNNNKNATFESVALTMVNFDDFGRPLRRSYTHLWRAAFRQWRHVDSANVWIGGSFLRAWWLWIGHFRWRRFRDLSRKWFLFSGSDCKWCKESKIFNLCRFGSCSTQVEYPWIQNFGRLGNENFASLINLKIGSNRCRNFVTINRPLFASSKKVRCAL